MIIDAVRDSTENCELNIWVSALVFLFLWACFRRETSFEEIR
jgi:hypothetical protein